MPDGTTDQGTGGKPPLPDKATDPEGYFREFYKREAEQAFLARDKAKEEARKLAERALPEDELQRLRAAAEAQAKADEDRKRKEGEFDALRTELVTKHQQELEAARKEAAELKAAIAQRELTAAFAQASDWFGPTSKTVLLPEIAQEYFAKYCKVEDGRVVVTRPNGEVIHGRDGNPAPFSEAIGELIAALPQHIQGSILRGSGKTGSGAAGGSLSMESDDLVTLTAKVKAGVAGAQEALQRKLQTKGGIVSGKAFQTRQ
jgi:hypothetical protein